jgi:hypothetical protein
MIDVVPDKEGGISSSSPFLDVVGIHRWMDRQLADCFWSEWDGMLFWECGD